MSKNLIKAFFVVIFSVALLAACQPGNNSDFPENQIEDSMKPLDDDRSQINQNNHSLNDSQGPRTSVPSDQNASELEDFPELEPIVEPILPEHDPQNETQSNPSFGLGNSSAWEEELKNNEALRDGLISLPEDPNSNHGEV